MNKITVSTLLILTILSGLFFTSCNSCNNDKPNDQKLEKVKVAVSFYPTFGAHDTVATLSEGVQVGEVGRTT